MLYLLDEDSQNAIIEFYNCGFIFDKAYQSKVMFFKNEEAISFNMDTLNNSDFVCYHNSFPNEKTKILDRLRFKHESEPNFYLVSFSGDSSFFNIYNENHFVKIHKDKFYNNLKIFIDTNFEMSKLLYGQLDKKNESELIAKRIFDILFFQNLGSFIDIKDFQPKDLRRICELADFDYLEFKQLINDKTVGQFKSIIKNLINNI